MAYDLNDIDEHGSLKPGVGVFLVALFLCRQLLYAPLALIANRKGRGSSGADIDMSFLQIYSIWEVAACFPSLIVLVALFLRKPGAAQWSRSLWRQSKNLLVFAALSQVAVSLYQFIIKGIDDVYLLVSLAVSVYLLFFILRSKRLADAVLDFPEKK